MGKDLKAAIQQYAKENYIDLIGFASKERFDGLDPNYSPFSIFPEGKTVILLGKRICRGSLRGVEEGSNFQDYSMFGYGWLDDEFLAISCYDITRVIENEGYEAVPVFPNPPEIAGQGVPVAKDRIAPNVAPDFDYAAVACGLGEISYNGLVFTEKFGSRQRFQMVITDAELESDPLLEQSICDNCQKCADICPLGAISKTEFETRTVCGKEMKVAKINYELCKKCKNGCVQNRLLSTSKPDRIAALCNRTCLVHLEEEKRIGNLFDEKFRKTQAWGFDGMGNSVKIDG